MTVGRPKGVLAPGSLASKLASLKVGDTLYLDDREPQEGVPTHMERSVQAVMSKSTALAGRGFSTERWVAIRTGPFQHRQLIGVKRTS
jgi:hypothetical protein